MKLLSLLVLGTFAAFANAAAVDNTFVERGCGGRKFYHPWTVHYTLAREEPSYLRKFYYRGRFLLEGFGLLRGQNMYPGSVWLHQQVLQSVRGVTTGSNTTTRFGNKTGNQDSIEFCYMLQYSTRTSP